MTAAARPPRGQCRPRAALRRPPRDRRRPPRSVAECYPVLNVTLTHSIPDTTALTSSIHAARAAIGRASRPGGAVLPLRPFITPRPPAEAPARRGGAGGAGTPGRLGRGRRAERGTARCEPRGPEVRPDRDPGPGLGRTAYRRCAGSQRRPEAPAGAATGRRSQGAPENPVSSAACRERLPEQAAGSVRVPGERCSKMERCGEPEGWGRKDFIECDRRPEGSLSPPTLDPLRTSILISYQAFKQVLYSLQSPALLFLPPSTRPIPPPIKRKYYNQEESLQFFVSLC